ncbi:MAG: D-tyrosyl-tRNA(Tyr) deacylase [Deltaproteobacteria bacterium]|nr:D-tyrosyl-tRNA(Tyr) deacylase [Deltaproteobacteria bacterium]
MRAVLQRVSAASVDVVEEGARTRVGEIGPGLLILLGVGPTDTAQTSRELAEKIVNMRIFADDRGRFDQSLLQTGGGALVVSQFTLFADTRRGRRPAFTEAAPPALAEPLYAQFCAALAAAGLAQVERGRFGAHMEVALVNDGPVTVWLDTAAPAGGQAP